MSSSSADGQDVASPPYIDILKLGSSVEITLTSDPTNNPPNPTLSGVVLAYDTQLGTVVLASHSGKSLSAISVGQIKYVACDDMPLT